MSLERRRRDGGKGKTPRDYLDFVIDGESLSEKIQGDFVSCFAWSDEVNTKELRRLLLEDEADFPNNRRSLYVCPECGDLGCGAISAVIEPVGDKIIWRDFGYENNYEEEVRFNGYENIKSFTFDKNEYETVLRSALSDK